MGRFWPFLLVLFLIAAFLQLDVFFTILYLFLALSLLSRLWLLRRAERLRAGRRFVDRAFAGESVAVDLQVKNDSWLPLPWLELHESLPVDLMAAPSKGQVVRLGPHQSWRRSYVLHCRRRGYYRIGPLSMRTGDLLGFVRTSHAQLSSDVMIVYPRVLSLERLGLPTRSPAAVLPAGSPLFEDPTRVSGVRDYQRGDSPRRIHWTATASVGRLVVKQYQPAIARESLICLDLGTGSYEPRQRHTATELAITVAASIAHHIVVREGLPAGLATQAFDPLVEAEVSFYLPPRSERSHLMGVLEVLARAQLASQTSLPDMLRRASVRLAWGATLVIITGQESAPLYDSLAQLRRAGFAVAMVLVQPPRPAADLRARAEQLTVPVHRVWREQDLERWR